MSDRRRRPPTLTIPCSSTNGSKMAPNKDPNYWKNSVFQFTKLFSIRTLKLYSDIYRTKVKDSTYTSPTVCNSLEHGVVVVSCEG